MNDNQSAFYVNQALPYFLYRGNPYDTPQGETLAQRALQARTEVSGGLLA
jgi:hypothetical protein